MSTYAIVLGDGTIVSIHEEPIRAGAGWGHDRELVELTREHRIGDRIDWDRHGVECPTAPMSTPDFDTALSRYLTKVEALYADYRATHGFLNPIHDQRLETMDNPRYVRVVWRRDVGGCVHSFIAKVANQAKGIKVGDVLKGSWKAPELKNPRGNILDATEAITHHGPVYLR